LIIPFQLLAYRTATAKGIDLSKRIFDDFDAVLKSKI
jgi:glucoselysine-6-phosphate deglycase